MDYEVRHFPLKRVLNFVLTLAILFLTSMMLKNKYQKEPLVKPVYGYLMLAVLIIYSVLSTIYNARNL